MWGVERIAPVLEDLSDRIAAGVAAKGYEVLGRRDPGTTSGIVSFRKDGVDSRQVVFELKARGILAAPRAGWVRTSPHFYIGPDEIRSHVGNATVNLLRACLAVQTLLLCCRLGPAGFVDGRTVHAPDSRAAGTRDRTGGGGRHPPAPLLFTAAFLALDPAPVHPDCPTPPALGAVCAAGHGGA